MEPEKKLPDKCIICNTDFTSKGWNKYNIEKHINKHKNQGQTSSGKKLTELWPKVVSLGKKMLVFKFI